MERHHVSLLLFFLLKFSFLLVDLYSLLSESSLFEDLPFMVNLVVFTCCYIFANEVNRLI